MQAAMAGNILVLKTNFLSVLHGFYCMRCLSLIKGELKDIHDFFVYVY